MILSALWRKIYISARELRGVTWTQNSSSGSVHNLARNALLVFTDPRCVTHSALCALFLYCKCNGFYFNGCCLNNSAANSIFQIYHFKHVLRRSEKCWPIGDNTTASFTPIAHQNAKLTIENDGKVPKVFLMECLWRTHLRTNLMNYILRVLYQSVKKAIIKHKWC